MGEEMTVEWRADAGAVKGGGLGLAAIGAAGCKQLQAAATKAGFDWEGLRLMALLRGGMAVARVVPKELG